MRPNLLGNGIGISTTSNAACFSEKPQEYNAEEFSHLGHDLTGSVGGSCCLRFFVFLGGRISWHVRLCGIPLTFTD